MFEKYNDIFRKIEDKTEDIRYIDSIIFNIISLQDLVSTPNFFFNYGYPPSDNILI